MQENESITNPQPTDISSQPSNNDSFPPAEESIQEKKPDKLLITGLVILVLAALGVAGVFAYQNYQLKKQIEKSSPGSEVIPTGIISTPTPTSPVEEETVNWKTYRNIEYGYTIKYPQNFFLHSEAKNRGHMLQFVGFTHKKYEKSMMGELPAIEVAVYRDEGLSFGEWFEKHATTKSFELSESPEIYYYKVTSKQEISINGVRGLQFVDNKITGAPIPTVIFSGKSVVISIRGYYFIHDESFQNIYNLILSTFKFTN